MYVVLWGPICLYMNMIVHISYLKKYTFTNHILPMKTMRIAQIRGQRAS